MVGEMRMKRLWKWLAENSKSSILGKFFPPAYKNLTITFWTASLKYYIGNSYHCEKHDFKHIWRPFTLINKFNKQHKHEEDLELQRVKVRVSIGLVENLNHKAEQQYADTEKSCGLKEYWERRR